MTGYVVDLDGLAELVDRMQRFQDELTTARDDLERRVGNLHLVWTGDAAAAHASAHRVWDTAAGQAQEALAILRSIAVTAYANYDTVSSTNRRMWSR